MNPQAQSVLDFWYDSRKPRNEQAKIWFAGKELDNTIREKFIDLIEKARTGQLKSWEDDSKSALAHILLIDQFCRNVYRGTAKAFDCDSISLGISKKVIASGKSKELNAVERFFLYLPFQHSENLDDQNTAIKLYGELAADYKGTDDEGLAKNGFLFAEKHREVVERFGRFPKRNAALGRQNTPEEEELLKNYPYTF